ncbi:S-adenosyl-L-methionine-dependent methyltransferases superfamily protein [Striga hermonthica]|uniref:S-adenosyl-L-methionine-dependent methyltransferases superfamily protein n=1 Tax=Striga hermonthica TaxID=68872 RepID=A0A9N7NKF2_STRHE|nr:S-adenosyl-L-methionine-dependent methyltransferases superfamily protein [Striga hermonthica]
MGFTMGLNLLLLLAMVATNILSLYHLSSNIQSKPPTPPPVPDHLIHQLTTIRATINHLTSLHPSVAKQTPSSASAAAPSDLLIYTNIAPIASSCRDNPALLHRYMNYTPFSLCPADAGLAEDLILRGCHPLPRRRCFSRTPPSQPQPPLPADPFSPLPDRTPFLLTRYACRTFSCLAAGSNPDMGFDMRVERSKFVTYRSELDLPIPQLLQIAASAGVAIRLAADVGGGTGTFAAQMKLRNVTVLTTTMSLGAPYSEAVAARGLIPLHAPLQQRLPVFDGVLDLVRCGRAVNRWIPATSLEFLLFDADRVLRAGGYLLLDRFFSKKLDLETVYGPMIGKLGYKKVKWAVADKNDPSGIKNGEVYLTALLQKPLNK